MIQNMLESTSDELGGIAAPRRSKEWVIAALLVVAAALCWISWRTGSPLVSGIRDFDVKSEILRLQKRPPGPPDFVIP
jgi:hypothetical protein